MHFVDSKAGIDAWKNVARLSPVGDDVADDPWDQADDVNPESHQPQEDLKLSGDVDDNKPFGGAEREGFGGFDNDMDDDGGYNS